MADTTQRRETPHRGFFRSDGDDSKQRAVGHQQQGARKVRPAAARHAQRRLADAFRRSARAALGGAGDGLRRAIQRPPAWSEIMPSSTRRRTAISTRRHFSQGAHRSRRQAGITRLRSHLKTVFIRCPTWRAKLMASHGRWTARKRILPSELCRVPFFPDGSRLVRRDRPLGNFRRRRGLSAHRQS